MTIDQVADWRSQVMTANQAAAAVGMTSHGVLKIARERSIGRPIADGPNRTIWLFSPAEVEAIRNRRDRRRKSA